MWPICRFPGQAQQPTDSRCFLFLWQLGKRCACWPVHRTCRLCWPLPGSPLHLPLWQCRQGLLSIFNKTMSHIVVTCPLSRFVDGDLFRLHSADQCAIARLQSAAAKAFANRYYYYYYYPVDRVNRVSVEEANEMSLSAMLTESEQRSRLAPSPAPSTPLAKYRTTTHHELILTEINSTASSASQFS